VEKAKLEQIVRTLPDQIDIDDFIERLDSLRRLELAEEEIASGKVISHEEVERRMAKLISM